MVWRFLGENMKYIQINDRRIGNAYPTYFIADIAANHDGDLARAKKLISLAQKAGADAVKFQHHDVKKYVSDYGFRSLGGKFSHQKTWEKSIFQVYKDAEVPTKWTETLKAHCEEIGIDFFSTPYDLDMIDHLNNYVPAFKIGSGDINWHAMLEKVAKTNKPVLFATGASTIGEVQKALEILSKYNSNIVLMQCNTNYTASAKNFKFINLNVLKTYKVMFPNVVLGLSDHTPGHVTVLGSVTLGARVVEKHFTDDTSRPGPDHPFSMDCETWKEMVDNTRLLELALGHSTKEVQENERETAILQRRAIRVTRNIERGELLAFEDIEYQRPCPEDALSINISSELIGKRFGKDIIMGDYLRSGHIEL